MPLFLYPKKVEMEQDGAGEIIAAFKGKNSKSVDMRGELLHE